jgi:hypothetical protein
MAQRQVMWAPTDHTINAPLHLTSPPLELDNGARLEEPGELTQPLTGAGEPQTETLIPIPHTQEPPSHGASSPQINTVTVLVNGSERALSFILSPDTTIAFLKQEIRLVGTSPPAGKSSLPREKRCTVQRH